MPTLYSDIHELLLNKISDYDILKLIDVEREYFLNSYLVSACARFNRICKIDLSDRDDILQQFNNDLDDEIKEILAVGECFYWLNPKVLNSDKLKNVLNITDFQQLSIANLLGQLQQLRDTLKKEFKQAIINYSYDTADISKLKM